MLENNNTNKVLPSYSAQSMVGSPIVSGYDRNLQSAPIDTYELEHQFALEQPEVESKSHNWFTDSWNNFSNKRDEIRLMTERGKLINEINPELEAIEARMNEENLSPEEQQRLLEHHKQLTDNKQSVLEQIADIEGDMSSRSGVSAYTKAKEQFAQDDSLGSPDYWKYSIPGTLGSSFSDMSAYLARAGAWAVEWGSSALAGAVAAGGTIASAGAGTGLALAAATGIRTAGKLAAHAINIWGVNEANKSEALAETFGAYKDKALQTFAKDGVNLYEYAQSLKLRDKSLADYSDDQVIDKLLAGEIQTNDQYIKDTLKASRQGVDSVYAKNRGLIALDLAQNALTFGKIGGLGKLTKYVKKASKLDKVTDPLSKHYDKVVDGLVGWQTRMAMKSPVKAAALSTTKKLAKYGLAAVSEGFEEGSQNVFNRDFLAGNYDADSTNMLKAYASVIDANYRVGKILAGLDTETELANDPDFYNEVKAGVALGLLMGGVGTAPSVTIGTAKELAANRTVRELTVDNIAKKDRFAKIEAYASRLASKLDYSDQMIESFENYKKHILPNEQDSGITEEDIDNEIKLVKSVRDLVNNKEFNAMAKAAGFAKGSQEYNAFLGLSTMAEDDVKEAREAIKESTNKYNEAVNNLRNIAHASDITEDEHDVATALTGLNAQISVLDDVIRMIESKPEEGKEKFGVLNAENPLAKRLLFNAKAQRKGLVKAAEELASDSKFDKTYMIQSDETNEVAKTFFEKFANEADYDLSVQNSQAYKGELVNKEGKRTNFSKLDKETKADVANSIKNKVNTFIKKRNETIDTIRNNATAFSNNQTQPADTATEGVAPIIQEQSPVDNTVPQDFIPEPVPFEEGTTGTPVTPTPGTSDSNLDESQTNALMDEAASLLDGVQANDKYEDPDDVDVEGIDTPGITVEDIDTEGIIVEEGEDSERVNVEDLVIKDEVQPVPTDNSSIDTTGMSNSDAAEAVRLSELSINDQLEELEDVADKVSQTLFYAPYGEKPLLPGYKSGKELSNFLNTPGILNECELRFFINPEYKTTYKAGDRSTYDDAPILLEVVHGKDKYLMALKTPNAASTMNVDAEAIERLRVNRNAIIEALESLKPGQKVVPAGIRASNGIYNNNTKKQSDGITVSVQRTLDKITGMNVPSDYHTITDNNVHIAIGRGIIGDFDIIDSNGQILPGKGNSGNLYYIAQPSQTFSGNTLPIQLNVSQFKHHNLLVRTLLNLFFGHQYNTTEYMTINGVETDIELEEIFNFVFNFGEHTLLKDPNDVRLPFLTKKQFGYNRAGRLVVGDRLYEPSNLSADQKEEIIDQVIENMHWSVSRKTFWGTLEDALPSVAEHFNNTTDDEVTIVPGLKFTRADFETSTTVMGWMIGNGLITSDAKNQLFTDPFYYYSGISVIDGTTAQDTTPQLAEGINETNNPLSTSSESQQSKIVNTENTDDVAEALKQAESGKDPLSALGLGGVFRTIEDVPSGEQPKPANSPVTDWERQWIKKNLGLDAEVKPEIAFYIGNSQWAMGVCRTSAIELYQSAEAGTGYHESFHRVSLLLLDPKSRKELYNTYRNRYKIPSRDDNSIEELLAEDFRQWMQATYDPELNIVRRLFNRIKYFVKTWFNKNDRAIYKLYEQIHSGYFKNVKVNRQSEQEFLERFKGTRGVAPFRYRGNEINSISNTQVEETINALSSAAILTNNVKFTGDLVNLDMSKIKAALNPSVTAALVNAGTLTPSQGAVRNEIYEKFDMFSKLVRDNLRKYKINVQDVKENFDKEIENKASGDYGDTGNALAQHTKSSLEISSKGNALTEVKVFVACLPNQKYVDGELVTVKSPATGLFTTVDFDKAWNTLANELAGCNTFQEIVDKSHKLGNQYALFKTFANQLEALTKTDPNDTEAAKIAKENLKTQIRNTFRKNKADLIFVTAKNVVDENNNTSVDIVISNESANRTIRQVLSGWANNLITNTSLVKIENGEFVSDETTNNSISKVSEGFNKLFSKPDRLVATQLKNYKNQLLSLLSQVGLEIDLETLNTVLSEYYYNPSELESFKSLLRDGTDNGVKFVFSNKLVDLKSIDKTGNTRRGNYKAKIDTFYDNVGFAKRLAEAHCIHNPSPEETSVLTTDGKLFYTITEHNYLSDYTQELDKNAEAVDKLANVTYVGGINEDKKSVKGSVIVDKLKKLHETEKHGTKSREAKLKVQTLVGFRKDQSSDTGRSYTEISPLENYITKMALTRANKVLLPTMGDSVRYDVLSGAAVKGFSFSNALVIRQKDDKMELNFDAKIINRFIKYFTTELETILYNYEHQPTKPEDKIANYDTGARNGYKLRYFDGIKELSARPDKTINQIIAEFEKDDLAKGDTTYSGAKAAVQGIINNWNKKSKADKTRIMNNYLTEVFKEELDYAQEIGLIKWDGKKYSSIENVAIPSKYVNDAKVSNPQNIADKYADRVATLDVLMTYFANSVSSIIEFGKIYTKDPAYYKHSVDMIKRLREVLSTGVVPRTDYPDNPEMSDFKEFTVGTLRDNEIVSRQFDEIKKSAARSYAFNLLQQRGYTEADAIQALDNGTADAAIIDQANAMAETRFKGYKKVNQTDATVLISPEGYKQLVRRIDGWTPEVAKAFEVLNDASILTDRNSKLYHDSLNAILKPLKVMFFGERDNADLKRSVPIFDKMALFPVFPVFATGDMKYIYQRMTDEKNPIHMLAFESAVKVGQDQKTAVYNEDGSVNIEGLASIVTHKQPLNRFRRQLVTDPHDAHHEQMFVSQAQKAAMLNIRVNNTYTTPDGEKVSGSDLYRNIFEMMNELTRRGSEAIDNKLGVRTNDNGDLELDKGKLTDTLRASAEASNMDQNTLDGLTPDANGRTAPLSGMSNNAWMESAIISLLNKEIVDVNTPGGMFIQMSSIAYNDLTVRTDGGVRDLKFDTKDGTIECVVSINLLKTIIPDYDKKSFIEAKEWLQNAGMIGRESAAMAMGYRIPAQGPSSVAALKVVDVYPENIGDTITLPDEWTALTGSDFDVDKLFVARYNFDKNGKKVKYQTKDEYTQSLRENHPDWDDEKIVLEAYKKYSDKTVAEANSREAIQNRLLDMYIASISNPLQYSESRQPLDAVTSYLTDKILADIDKLQGNEGSSKPQLYTATPGFQNRTKADLTAGKQNLGAMALGNSHHMLAQAVHLVTQGHKNIDHFNLNQLGNIYSQDPNFHDKQTIVTLISDWISAMINAHVDVAKDPYINRLNVRKFTLNMTNYLLRAGKGESTFYFLSQKILRDIASEFEALSGYYGVDDNLGDAASAAKSKVKQTYLDKLNSFGWTLDKVNAELERMTKPGGINPFDIKTLREFMPEDNSAKWYLNQLAILKVFEDIEPFAKALSENTKLSQIDTKKYGNNFALQQNFLIKMAEFAQNDKVFADPLSVIRNTFLKDKLYYALIRPRQYVGNVLLRTTPEFENKRRKIYQITGRHHASSDKYVNDITRMMEACYKTTFWKEYAAKNGVKVGSLLAGSNSVPRRLYTIKQLIKSNPALGLLNSDGSFSNTLLDSISMMIKTDKQDMVLPDFIQFKHNRSDDHNLDDHLIRAWEELLELTTTDATLQPQVDIIRNFARDLVIYSFFTSGDAFGRNNIFKYVPESFRESCGYYDYIRKLESEPSTILDKIDEEDVIKNLWWNDEVVPSHNEIIKEYYDDEFVKHYELNNWYIPSNKTVRKGVEDVPVPLLMSVPKAKVIGLNTLEQPLYQPYIKVDFGGRNNPLTTHMYRFVGTREFEVIGRNGMPVLDSEGKPVTRQQPIYTLINKKGLKHKGRVIVETSGIPRSLLGINNNNELPKDFFINNAIKFNLDSNKSMNLKAEEGYVGEIEWLKDKLFGTINEQSEYKVLDKRSDESVSLALDWSVKEGWSVDYFYNKVEPRLQEAWQIEFEYLHDQNQKAQFEGQMTYSYRHNKRPEIKSNTTFEAIQRGERTATTRYESDGKIDYWKQAKVGDVIAWNDGNDNIVKVKVTKPLTKLLSQSESNNPADYIIHSGGAYGADTMWDEVARSFGISNINHYRDADNTKLSSKLSKAGITAAELSESQMNEARKEMSRLFNREFKNNLKDNLKVRNYYQVVNSDAVYAVAELNADFTSVKGGTSYAVNLAKKLNKPVYVFSPSTRMWYEYAYDVNVFEPTATTPRLSQRFAGIGTRDIELYKKKDKTTGAYVDNPNYLGKDAEDASRNAIVELFNNAFGTKSEIDDTTSSSPTALNTYSGLITKDDPAIFVFGSNSAAYNGNPIKGTGGAALAALNQGRIEQREQMANTLSKSGRAYGIQTVTTPGAKKSLSEQEIVENIVKFYRFAVNHPDNTFKVAYTYSEKPNLNGYTSDDMATMFALAFVKAAQELNNYAILNNIQFHESFAPLVNEAMGMIREELREEIKEELEQIANQTPKSELNTTAVTDAKLAQEFEQFVAETSTWYDEQDIKSVQKELSELPEVKTTPSFTFADGTKIDTPFELNEQQKFALLELEKFYNGNETFFSLQGYAGTGKTTIMKIFDAYMRKKYDQPLYLAPTHKANAVTKANNPDVNASTVHSALGIVPSYDMTSDSFDVSKITFDDPGEAKIEKQQVVILDECSMLPDALVDYICDAVREKDSKLIFLGDPAQLSPVKQSTLSKSFNMNSKVELTKVERTGDNSILKEATNLRESKPLSYQTDLNSKGQGIMFTNNNNTIAILLQSVLKSDEFKANPLHFKILSGTNDLIPIYNNIVRTILYGKDAPTLVKGELLMSYANAQYNNKNKKRPYNIINSGDYMVDKIDEVTNKSIPHMPGFEITGRNVELIELPSGHRIKTFLVDKSVPNKTLRAITLRVRELWAENKRLRAEKQFTAAGIIFDQIRDIEQSFTTMSNIIDEETGAVIKSKTFDYGYTQSVHKSQGSTYDKVMVIGGSFDKFPSESIRQQLKYVAVTRAREQVIYTVPTNVQVNPQGLSQITKAKWAEIQERLKQCKG